jgi:hypothetical protein
VNRKAPSDLALREHCKREAQRLESAAGEAWTESFRHHHTLQGELRRATRTKSENQTVTQRALSFACVQPMTQQVILRIAALILYKWASDGIQENKGEQ